MAYDPIQEDCLRLILGSLQRAHIYPLEHAVFVESCIEKFNRDPSTLIVNDCERAFHLVAQAATVIDYRLPFATDNDTADREAATAEAQLREACVLDPSNWDAQRMLAALESESNDAYVAYLINHRAEVAAAYEETMCATQDVYSREYARDLGKRPYVRWLAALASHALIAGQYRLSLQAVEDCLSLAPDDPADVRHTAVLTMAKLEYTRDDLARFRARHAASYRAPGTMRRRHHLAEKTPDAWECLAELAIAYHELDFTGATRALRTLMRIYPRAAEPLFFQPEFPEGVFGRVNVEPGSDDELVLALSEATPLLQEGLGAPDNASLAVWIATHDLVQGALEQQDARAHSSHGTSNGGEN